MYTLKPRAKTLGRWNLTGKGMAADIFNMLCDEHVNITTDSLSE